MVGPIECTRLWLPERVCAASEVEELSLALVGWANVGLKSVDLVVAAACPVAQFSNHVVRQLQEVLDAAEAKLPLKLRMEGKLRVIGRYFISSDLNSIDNQGNEDSGPGDDRCKTGEDGVASGAGWQRGFPSGENDQGCHSWTGSPEIKNVWAVVSAHKSSEKKNELEWIPDLRSLSVEGSPACAKANFIIYQQPVFGSHHFSCIPWTPYEVSSQNFGIPMCKTTFKRPQWMAALEHQQVAPDMEMIMTELNCATYIDGILKDIWPSAGFYQKHSTVSSICCDVLWCPVAALVAIWATMLYALARVLVLVLTVCLPALPYLGSLLQRSVSLQTMHLRCQQLMAWPFVLLWGGFGPEQPNVAIAHKMTIARNSIWSVLFIDKIIGAIIGYLLLKHHALIMQLAVQTGQILTNDILKTGCVWLMGVPAGFKLNNELAAAIGSLSLHAIQSWSTLLYSLVPAIEVFLRILGISSFLLGFTVPAAIMSDMVYLSTIHISCLHHAIAFVHTNQLQALAALWRLFRGRKRNLLRGRLDSFDCSMEQLVVASLMFTPLLLLLPTTSVYYTFFSMIFLTVSSVQVMLHYVIAIFHCFPFSLVAKWIIQPKQFPSGIWFRFPDSACTGNKSQEALLSILGIQTASFAELLKPFLRSLWVTPEWSSAAIFVYKVVSGQSSGEGCPKFSTQISRLIITRDGTELEKQVICSKTGLDTTASQIPRQKPKKTIQPDRSDHVLVQNSTRRIPAQILISEQDKICYRTDMVIENYSVSSKSAPRQFSN